MKSYCLMKNSMLARKIAVLGIVAALFTSCFSSHCYADEPSPFIWEPNPSSPGPTSLPSHSPQVEFLREAKFRLGEGEQLYKIGDRDAAREKWKEAAALFGKAKDGLGEADAYLLLANSYALPELIDEKTRQIAFDYYMSAIWAASGVYEELIQKSLVFDQNLLRQADALYQEGREFFEQGRCDLAAPLLDQARTIYKKADYGAGEIRALMTKAHCLAQNDDLSNYLTAFGILLDALGVIERLPLGTPTSERYLQGLNLYRRGHFEEALEALNEALTGYKEARDEAGIAQTLNDLGNVYAAQGDYTRAQGLYRQALSMFVAQTDWENQGAVWNNLGNLALLTGEFAAAQENYARALDIWQRLGVPHKEVAALNGLGMTWREMGKYEQALTYFKTALGIAERLYEAQEEQGDALNNIGYVYYSQGQLTTALDYYNQALLLYRELPGRLKEANCLSNIGSAYADLGEHQTALAHFQMALEIGEQTHAEPLIVKSLLNVAAVHLQQGVHQEAIGEILRSLDYIEKSGEKPTLAMVHSNLGAAYLKFGNADQAVYHLKQARDIFEATGHFEGMAFVTVNLGVIHLQSGDLKRAEHHFQESLAAWKQVGSLSGQARALGNLGAVAEMQGDYKQALVYLSEALTWADQAGIRADKTRLLILTASSYLGLGEIEKARLFGWEALELAQSIEDPTLEMAAWLVLGMTDYAVGELESAYEYVLTSMGFLESLQGTITVRELKETFLGATADAYALGVTLAYETHRPKAAFLHAEQARARTLLNQLSGRQLGLNSKVEQTYRENTLRLEIIALEEKLRLERSKPENERSQDIVDYLDQQLVTKRQAYSRVLLDLQVQDPSHVALVTGQVLNLEDTQTLLDGDTTLLEYFVTENQTFAFVVERDSFQLIALDVGRRTLRNQTDHLRAVLSSDLELSAKTESLSWFYRSLIAPILPHIKGSQLGIVPHDALYYVPFAALTDGEQYLIERFPLFYLPSASVLPFLSSHLIDAEQPSLVLAHPGVRGTSHLTYVSKEAHAVASFYDTQPFIGQNAQESLVKAKAANHTLLHIAAHGELVPSNPLFSAVWLEPDEHNDGRLEVHEVFSLDLSQTNLVVLSACQTQVSPMSQGDELVSLQRAFIYAGSPSVVSSLWSVNDEATWKLMTAFHHHLRQGLSKAHALQMAQLEVQERFNDPYFWAAFTLSGDPNSLFAPESNFRLDWIVFGLYFLSSRWLLRIINRDSIR